jgi:ABC-2 type transport system permease protein
VLFLAPGIIVMSALYTAAYAGLGVLSDIQSGMLEQLLAAPRPRYAILAGSLLYLACLVTVQSVVLLLVACAVARSFPLTWSTVPLIWLAPITVAMAIGSLSLAVALRTRRQQALIAVVNLVALPLTFLSSMMIAPSLMPPWMRLLTTVNPIDWSVRAARESFFGMAGPAVLPLLAASALAALATALAMRTLESFE